MSFSGADIPFVGSAYEAPDLLQDAQRLVNWYCEISSDPNSKEPIALLGCPGYLPLISTIPGQVRGSWVLPGGQQCLFVVANQLYVSTVTVPATQTSIAQFSTVAVGTLATNSGRVVIRDNGVLFNGNGGYALLVDGANAYYYRLGGAGIYQFTGGVSNTSTTITLPGPLPTGLLISAVVTLSDTSAFIPANTKIASINYNTPSITMTAAATGTNASETITLTIPVFGQLNDPGFVGADRVAFIEGWLLINQPGTRTFQTTGPVPYTLMFPPSFFALKDSSTDNLETLYENNREAWLIGSKTSEVWFNSGGATFAFSRLPGIGPQIGTAAKHSIARVGSDLMWLARNETGENFVIRTQQYSWQRVSTHAIEKAIASYPLTSDAIGDSYIEEGHVFYVLTFPTADVTWVLDLTTYERTQGAHGWHQRLSWDQTSGIYHRNRANTYVNFADLILVGDYQSGQIHQVSRQIYTDAGNILRCQRRTPHVWKKRDRTRIFFSSLQVEFTPGVGLQTGQGSNPQAMLRWSDDGGFTWNNEHWATIGAAGQTRNRAIWRRLGYARDRVWELNYSDPTARDIIGATLYGEAEGSEAA